MSEEKRDWSYSVPADGGVFPEHLIGAVWSFLQWSEFERGFLRKPSSREQLANLVHPAFQASLCSEEGRQVRLRVAFNPTPKRFTVPFAESRPYSAGQLIKLAPTIG